MDRANITLVCLEYLGINAFVVQSAKCIIYNGLSWYNLRELCERKFTTTDRCILHLFHSVARVAVIDVGVDFVTINELAHTALVLCEKLRLCRFHVIR